MSINIENLVKEYGKECLTTEGAKRVYFNGENKIKFLTALNKSLKTSMPIPEALGKNKLFQLTNGVFATDNGITCYVLRASGLEVIRLDKEFSKIKAIEKPEFKRKKSEEK